MIAQRKVRIARIRIDDRQARFPVSRRSFIVFSSGKPSDKFPYTPWLADFNNEMVTGNAVKSSSLSKNLK